MASAVAIICQNHSRVENVALRERAFEPDSDMRPISKHLYSILVGMSLNMVDSLICIKTGYT